MKFFFSIRNQFSVICSALCGTTLMTVYSYIISRLQNKNFKEPKLLGKMSENLLPWLDRRTSRITGWYMHYLVGLLFAETYAPFWPATGKKGAYIKTGLILGGISGISAILLWKFSLNAHPFPPAVDFIPFAGQLLIAHLFFGFFAAVGYMVSRPKVV
ncbi:MAG: hypothetical protein ABJB86_23350 [Bacteroidota bacterium]